jgi:hypothetical protein
MITDQEQSTHTDRHGLHFRSPALVRGNGIEQPVPDNGTHR